MRYRKQLYTRNIITYYLNTIGVLSYRQRRIWQFYILTSIFITIGSKILFYLNYSIKHNNDILNVANMLYLVETIYISITLLYQYYKKDQLKKILNFYEKGIFHYSYENNTNINKKYPKKNKNNNVNNSRVAERIFRKYMSLYISVVVIGTCVIYIGPLFKVLLLHGNYTSCENLIYPGWYPWYPFNNKMQYILTYVTQILVSMPFVLHEVIQSLFNLYFILEVKEQTFKLCTNLKNQPQIPKNNEKNQKNTKFQISENGDLEKTLEANNSKNKKITTKCKFSKILDPNLHRDIKPHFQPPESGLGKLQTNETVVVDEPRRLSLNGRPEPDERDDEKYEKLVLDHLKECTKHHKSIIEFINIYLSPFQILFDSMLLTTIAISVLTVFNIKSKNSLEVCIFALQCGFILFDLFYYSYMAEVLIQANEDIQNALYNSKWYNNSAKCRKHVFTIMLRCQRGFKLKVIGPYFVGYELYALVIKLTYSIISLLLK